MILDAALAPASLRRSFDGGGRRAVGFRCRLDQRDRSAIHSAAQAGSRAHSAVAFGTRWPSVSLAARRSWPTAWDLAAASRAIPLGLGTRCRPHRERPLAWPGQIAGGVASWSCRCAIWKAWQTGEHSVPWRNLQADADDPILPALRRWILIIASIGL
jgi:hypothetical protein